MVSIIDGTAKVVDGAGEVVDDVIAVIIENGATGEIIEGAGVGNGA